MLGFEKVYSVHTCLSLNSRGATKARLKQVASCSEATLFRIIRFMRRELNAPIEHVNSGGLYRYQSGIVYELPGIWFKGHELASLLELLSRLEELQAEFLTGATLKPLIEKLETLLESRQVPKSAINQRVKFLPMQMRQINGEIFRSVMETLFAGKQMRIRHQDRTVGKITERKISPQKIVRYRDN